MTSVICELSSNWGLKDNFEGQDPIGNPRHKRLEQQQSQDSRASACSDGCERESERARERQRQRQRHRVSVCLCWCVCVSSVRLSVCPSVCLFVCRPASLSVFGMSVSRHVCIACTCICMQIYTRLKWYEQLLRDHSWYDYTGLMNSHLYMCALNTHTHTHTQTLYIYRHTHRHTRLHIYAHNCQLRRSPRGVGHFGESLCSDGLRFVPLPKTKFCRLLPEGSSAE